MKIPFSNRGRGSVHPGCMLLGFAVFLAFGWLNTYDLVWKPWSSWFAARSWKEVRCTIVSSKVVAAPGQNTETWYIAEITYRYVAGGLVRRGSRYSFEPSLPPQKLVALYPEDMVTTCWVDPENPEEAVLNRDVSVGRMTAIGLFPLLFLVAGVGGILWVLGSRFRRIEVTHG